MSLYLSINGQQRSFEELGNGSFLSELVEKLGFRADRIALELNGEIVPRGQWAATAVHTNDRLEAVHFVGGGADPQR